MRKEPWQMTREEWDQAREECHPNTLQTKFTKKSGSEAIREFAKMRWLCFDVRSEDSTRIRQAGREEIVLSSSEVEKIQDRLMTPVTHFDVVQRALRLGLPVPEEALSEYHKV